MISAEQVRELRAKTGAGIMECKKALNEVDGNLEKAVAVLRKSGLAKAGKKAARATKEGRVEIVTESGGKKAAIIEVNCETDFVARTDDFQSFTRVVAEHILQAEPADVPALLASELAGSGPQSVESAVQELIGKLGENMGVARFQVSGEAQDGQKVGSYIHAGNQIGVIVVGEGKLDDDDLKDVAMHIAAMSPRFLSADEVPDLVASSEKDILAASEDMAGKPPEVAKKMVEGRYKKFLSQVCLMDQAFIKDPQGKQTVSAYLKSLDPKARITEFIRFQVGENSGA